MKHDRSAYLKAIEHDNSLPIEQAAMELWLRDLDNPFRWIARPFFQFVFAVLLHLTWFFKRLPLPQFRAHGFLQWTICWFCKYLVSPETNLLIMRHYTTESNLLNFLLANSEHADEVEPIKLYPQKINDMIEDSFVMHDQELFRLFADLGAVDNLKNPREGLSWDNWQPLDMDAFTLDRKPTQIFDFETSHALFMCLFCFLLTREEYRDAINGFNLDQSIAIRVGLLTGDNNLSELAYNKYPHYLVGPWNLGQRFLMHGFFTEHLYAYLENLRLESLPAIDEAATT